MILATPDPGQARVLARASLKNLPGMFFCECRIGSDNYQAIWLDQNKQKGKKFECPAGYPSTHLDKFDAFFCYRGEIIEFQDVQAQVCKRCQNALKCLMDPYVEGTSKKKEAPCYWTPLSSAVSQL